MSKVALEVLDSEFTIHRFPPTDRIPEPVLGESFFWVGKTDEELSIVCDSCVELVGSERNTGWACFKVIGPVDFSVTGLIAGISSALAEARISMFSLSTFDTDYILVKATQFQKAQSVLIESGYAEDI